jgi:hypothetical protein
MNGVCSFEAMSACTLRMARYVRWYPAIAQTAGISLTKIHCEVTVYCDTDFSSSGGGD